MAQIFPKALNPIAKMLVLGLPLLGAASGVTGAAFYRSSYATGVGETPPQPVAFSHAHHVGQLGIHCVYCHTTVETSGFANIPPTKTCMNCHQQIWQGADLLEPVRNSYKNNTPIEWNRVHNLPHYAYFNHSIHVAKGVGCVTCHGRLDQMNLTMQASTLLMEWCIACHRAPEKHLRPKDEVFNMQWEASQLNNPKKTRFNLTDQSLDNLRNEKVPDAVLAKLSALKNKEMGQEDFEKGLAEALGPDDKSKYFTPVLDQVQKVYHPYTQRELGLELKEKHRVRDAVTLTNCSMCHR